MADIVGKVVIVMDVERVSDRFKKRTIVVETEDPQYPQQIPVEFSNDRVALLDNLHADQVVRIHYDVRGRGWQPPDGGDKRWFVSLSGWRIDVESQSQMPPPPAQESPAPASTSVPPPAPSESAGDAVDEIPF